MPIFGLRDLLLGHYQCPHCQGYNTVRQHEFWQDQTIYCNDCRSSYKLKEIPPFNIPDDYGQGEDPNPPSSND